MSSFTLSLFPHHSTGVFCLLQHLIHQKILFHLAMTAQSVQNTPQASSGMKMDWMCFCLEVRPCHLTARGSGKEMTSANIRQPPEEFFF